MIAGTLINDMSQNYDTINIYFLIRGDFPLQEVLDSLCIVPKRTFDRTDIRRDGKPYGFSMIQIEDIVTSEPLLYKEMEKLVDVLSPFADKLIELKNRYNLEYFLEVVPQLYVDHIHPCLAPSLKVMEFCVKTKTNMDIDLYLYPDE